MSLTRKTPLGRKPRSRGGRGEREVIDLYKSFGWTGAYRNWQSGGQGGGDVLNGPPGTSTEVKYCEAARIWDWLAQCENAAAATDLPILAFRRNRSPWWAAIPAHEFEALRDLQGAPRTIYIVWREQDRCRLWDWIDAATTEAPALGPNTMPAVRFKRPGGLPYCALPLEELLKLLKLREAA